MKKVSVKDFALGALAAVLFMMLLGAKPGNGSLGRYATSVGGGGGGYSVCVTDTVTGDTRCYHRGLNDDKWSFTPDFSEESTQAEDDSERYKRNDSTLDIGE